MSAGIAIAPSPERAFTWDARWDRDQRALAVDVANRQLAVAQRDLDAALELVQSAASWVGQVVALRARADAEEAESAVAAAFGDGETAA